MEHGWLERPDGVALDPHSTLRRRTAMTFYAGPRYDRETVRALTVTRRSGLPLWRLGNQIGHDRTRGACVADLSQTCRTRLSNNVHLHAGIAWE
jgi:hypothetical protein